MLQLPAIQPMKESSDCIHLPTATTFNFPFFRRCINSHIWAASSASLSIPRIACGAARFFEHPCGRWPHQIDWMNIEWYPLLHDFSETKETSHSVHWAVLMLHISSSKNVYNKHLILDIWFPYTWKWCDAPALKLSFWAQHPAQWNRNLFGKPVCERWGQRVESWKSCAIW